MFATVKADEPKTMNGYQILGFVSAKLVIFMEKGKKCSNNLVTTCIFYQFVIIPLLKMMLGNKNTNQSLLLSPVGVCCGMTQVSLPYTKGMSNTGASVCFLQS